MRFKRSILTLPLRLLLFALLLCSIHCPSANAQAAAEDQHTPLPWAWPIQHPDWIRAAPYAAFVQATATGLPESARFGCVRNDGQRYHEGLDIAPYLPRRRGHPTDPVFAVHEGVVVHINATAGHSSYGMYVVLEHPRLNPAIYSLYAHMGSVDRSVSVGQTVAAGSQLGIMGNSAGGYRIPLERSHLHFEIGLRLGEGFQGWFDQQDFSSPNHHGNFNGMNLVGWDPLAYMDALRADAISEPMDFLLSIPPAVAMEIHYPAVPAFARRNPGLWIGTPDNSPRAAWKLVLSAFGLPLALQELRAIDIKGQGAEGQIHITAVERDLLAAYSCRSVVTQQTDGSFALGRDGRRIVELIFSD